MIVVTMDTASRSRALYWDGKQVAKDQDQVGSAKVAPFSIGARHSFRGGRYLPGSIDEVALWGRALSADEVTAIYNSAK